MREPPLQIEPLERMEVALVKAATARTDFLAPREEMDLRTALSLARVSSVAGPSGEVDLAPVLAPFREEVLRRLGEQLLGNGTPPQLAAAELKAQSAALRELTQQEVVRLKERMGESFPLQALEDEVRHKKLVLVTGGGGGSGYVYLGAFSALEDFGFRPALISGTSMGAIMGLFRARVEHFDPTDVVSVVRGLTFSKIFRLISMESRYGLPAPLRLYLRAAIGKFFSSPEGVPLNLSDLKIPLLVTVAGIRRGRLPKDVSYYESAANISGLEAFKPWALRRRILEMVRTLKDQLGPPGGLESIQLGATPGTESFDALDAVGFSCSLPGVIHYDVIRPDERMHGLLGQLFERYDLFRLADGGVVANVPARAALQAVKAGRIGTRNSFILAMDGFAPKFSTPVWLPLQNLAAVEVERSRAFAHQYKAFRRTLSPLELVPTVESIARAIETGKREMMEEMPFVSRMLAPLPPLFPASGK